MEPGITKKEARVERMNPGPLDYKISTLNYLATFHQNNILKFMIYFILITILHESILIL